jgi:VWFA-related protein
MPTPPRRKPLLMTMMLIAGPAIMLAHQTAQQAAPADQVAVPTFRTGTELVMVDVGVADRQGQPASGLGLQDFVVTVAGKPRRVISVEYVDSSAKSAANAPAPEADADGVSTNEATTTGRLVVFIVDQSSLDTGAAQRLSGAAGRFFESLTLADRSALIQLPAGPNIPFTWHHDRVRTGLSRAAGLAGTPPEWTGNSLSDARDVATLGSAALRTIVERECGARVQSNESADACATRVQMEAEAVWRQVHINALSSIAALRQMLARLANVPGDKSVILIAGGLPLDERDDFALLSSIAKEAAEARTTLFTIFAPTSSTSVARARMSPRPGTDEQLLRWPLETIADLTGGRAFRGDIGAEETFNQLSRELAGYYRLGVERTPEDATAKSQRLKVQVARNGFSVRTRELFNVTAIQDRDQETRLADALMSLSPATAVGLRVTSYVAADTSGSGQLSLMLAGEATRIQPGPATFQIALRNTNGGEVITKEQPLGDATTDRLAFSTNVPIPPGSYIVRLAVMDGEGRVGSVDHRVEARRVPVGPMTASGPLLIRVPSEQGAASRLAVDDLRQNDRLALQMDLEGERERPEGTDVTFEIAATMDGPALITTPGAIEPGPDARTVLAQAVADLRVLPPGAYTARVKVRSGGTDIGELRRGFTISAGEGPPASAPVIAAGAAGAAGAGSGATANGSGGRHAGDRSSSVKARALATAGSFRASHLLAAPVLGAYLDRLSARPDVSSPNARALVEQARTTALGSLVVSDALAAEAPVAAPFLRGLALLAQGRLDPAAQAFRTAMRASTDFSPAMIYLGACYAAAGNHKDAASAWQTALFRERDNVRVYVLLADAHLRTDRPELALQALTRARERWPADDEVTRRYVAASIAAGRYAEGLAAMDGLLERRTEDEPILTLGLLVLYDAFTNQRPVATPEQDRVRMDRYAAAYRTRGGPSLALVETWMNEVAKRAR